MSFVNLLTDNWHPTRRDFQTGLADGVSQACHMCTLLIFPVPAVGLLASFQLLAGGLHWHAGPIWNFPDVPISVTVFSKPHN